MINPQINNDMEENMDKLSAETDQSSDKKPDENSGIYVQSHIKIFDPESNEIFVEGRA